MYLVLLKQKQSVSKDNSTPQDIESLTRRLLAACPDYIYAQQRMDNDRDHNRHPDHRDLQTASYFNDLVRDFALRSPDTRFSDTYNALLDEIDKSLDSPELKEHAAFELGNTLRGAQHELGFAQIVRHTGRNITSSNVSEDLRGIDFTVQGDHRPINIDVKAHPLRIHGDSKDTVPFILRGPNVKMFSTIEEHEFEDSFFLPEDVAEQKAAYIDQQIIAAEDALWHRGHWQHRHHHRR